MGATKQALGRRSVLKHTINAKALALLIIPGIKLYKVIAISDIRAKFLRKREVITNPQLVVQYNKENVGQSVIGAIQSVIDVCPADNYI